MAEFPLTFYSQAHIRQFISFLLSKQKEREECFDSFSIFNFIRIRLKNDLYIYETHLSRCYIKSVLFRVCVHHKNHREKIPPFVLNCDFIPNQN